MCTYLVKPLQVEYYTHIKNPLHKTWCLTLNCPRWLKGSSQDWKESVLDPRLKSSSNPSPLQPARYGDSYMLKEYNILYVKMSHGTWNGRIICCFLKWKGGWLELVSRGVFCQVHKFLPTTSLFQSSSTIHKNRNGVGLGKKKITCEYDVFMNIML